jgi:hypothetical protein
VFILLTRTRHIALMFLTHYERNIDMPKKQAGGAYAKFVDGIKEELEPKNLGKNIAMGALSGAAGGAAAFFAKKALKKN